MLPQSYLNYTDYIFKMTIPEKENRHNILVI